jgi:AcrR family transcriptional regulator
MGVAQRRAREREEVRLALIEAAREVLSEDGYEGLTIRRVAERAEYGLGTVYSYFSDKDDLLYALVRDDFNRLNERLRAIRDTHKGVDAVREILLSYVRMGLERPRSYEIMFMRRPRLAGRNVEDESEDHAYAVFRRCIVACIKAGQFRPADPDVLAQGLWASVHGVVSLTITLVDVPWSDPMTIAEHVVEAELRGLAPAGSVA